MCLEAAEIILHQIPILPKEQKAAQIIPVLKVQKVKEATRQLENFKNILKQTRDMEHLWVPCHCCA